MGKRILQLHNGGVLINRTHIDNNDEYWLTKLDNFKSKQITVATYFPPLERSSWKSISEETAQVTEDEICVVTEPIESYYKRKSLSI